MGWGPGSSSFSDIYLSVWMWVCICFSFGKQKVSSWLHSSLGKYFWRWSLALAILIIWFWEGRCFSSVLRCSTGKMISARRIGVRNPVWKTPGLRLWIQILSSNPVPTTSCVILGKLSRFWISVSPLWNRDIIIPSSLGYWTEEESTFKALRIVLGA